MKNPFKIEELTNNEGVKGWYVMAGRAIVCGPFTKAYAQSECDYKNKHVPESAKAY